MPTQQELEDRIATLESLLTQGGIEFEKVLVPTVSEAVELAPITHPELRDPVINPPYDPDLAPIVEPEPISPIINPRNAELAPVIAGHTEVLRVKNAT